MMKVLVSQYIILQDFCSCISQIDLGDRVVNGYIIFFATSSPGTAIIIITIEIRRI